MCPVYPRTGGEHPGVHRPRLGASGLSPHRRGTPGIRIYHLCGFRFIPAQAGNTQPCCTACPYLAVYPRTGGEHEPLHCLSVGLSPHRRGTRGLEAFHFKSRRFIPAQAGNTTSSAWTRFIPAQAGNSMLRSTSRFIPAQAGNTPWSHILVPAQAGNTILISTVYPRTGGEHVCEMPTNGISDGLSPHRRGTPSTEESGFREHRFIPAQAGNTFKSFSSV